MTIKEAASAWGITERRVNELCKAGRISGAYKEGRQWFIPDGTQKPMDKRGRRSAVKPAVSSARKPLPIGVSDYRDACKNYYYVDKTLMIKEFLDERPKVSLFTRPRRFGKTLNMDMLRTFFEKTTEDTSVYFRDKKIWSCGESYLAHHRKYPVIFLSFKDVKYTSWEETYQTLQKLIAQEFRRHDELAASSALSDYEKEEYSLLAEIIARERRKNKVRTAAFCPRRDSISRISDKKKGAAQGGSFKQKLSYVSSTGSMICSRNWPCWAENTHRPPLRWAMAWMLRHP